MIGFVKRRLHMQIYATIIAALLLVVLTISLLFSLLQERSMDHRIFDITAKLTWLAMPPATAPLEQQKNALVEMGEEFDISIALFDQNKKLIAYHGREVSAPEGPISQKGWSRHRGVKGIGPVWFTRFPDGRFMVVDPRDGGARRGLVALLITISALIFAIGIASYPFVRKLTGRVERLQKAVTAIGTGDLSTRVEVEGQDEVADLAQNFNTAADQIEILVNSHRQLLAHASHELRTPLSRVRLGVEMLKKKPDAKRQQALEQDIAELDDLIDEILLMSRLDTGAKSSRMEPLDLLALASEECVRYDKCNLTGPSTMVWGDATLLRRAIRNLIDNAFKHGRPPVEVSIMSDGQVTLTVSDHGDGIPEDQRDHVFQPFHRAPGKQNINGYGLGLSLVKQIMKSHDGSVEIIDNGLHKSAMALRLPPLNSKV